MPVKQWKILNNILQESIGILCVSKTCAIFLIKNTNIILGVFYDLKIAPNTAFDKLRNTCAIYSFILTTKFSRTFRTYFNYGLTNFSFYSHYVTKGLLSRSRTVPLHLLSLFKSFHTWDDDKWRTVLTFRPIIKMLYSVIGCYYLRFINKTIWFSV